MGIGAKIKEHRKAIGLTQRDLSEKLNVTFQAVSRWENEDVEPSLETIKEMAKIFNCSLNELLDFDNSNEQKVVETLYVNEKPVLAVCQNCNRPIYNGNEIKRFSVRQLTDSMRRTYTTIDKVYCEDCNNKRIAKEEKEKKIQQSRFEESLRKRRIHSLIWPTVLLLAGLIAGIVFFVKGNTTYGAVSLALGVTLFTFVACLILYNNPIIDMWDTISSWSIKFPGILFTLDLNGILGFFAIKIAFAILGFLISIAAFLFANVFCMIASLFIYPFALAKNIKKVPGQLE